MQASKTDTLFSQDLVRSSPAICAAVIYHGRLGYWRKIPYRVWATDVIQMKSSSLALQNQHILKEMRAVTVTTAVHARRSSSYSSLPQLATIQQSPSPATALDLSQRAASKSGNPEEREPPARV